MTNRKSRYTFVSQFKQKQITITTLKTMKKLTEEQKIQAQIEAKKNQKEVKEITISIEWKKSRMYGNNPNCEAKILFADGSTERSKVYKASGCGYDKESTVIADVFNDYLGYALFKLDADAQLPYGMRVNTTIPYYEGGVGTSCYYRIAEAIGGKFDCIASGKTYDAYKFNF